MKHFPIFSVSVLCLLLIALVVLGGTCIECPLIPEGKEAILYDSRGNPSEGLEGGETAFFEFKNLNAKTQYDIKLKDASGAEVSLARLTTDADGKIPMTAIGYDLGLEFGSKFKNMAGETYTLEVYDLDGNLVLGPVSFTVDNTAPVVFAADERGDASNSFQVNAHDVYAKGVNLTPGIGIDIYVVDDVVFWADSMALVDISGGPEQVTVGGDGTFFVLVWTKPSLVSAYDIVADIDKNGIFTQDDLVDSYLTIGFMVQAPTTGADIQLQVACDNRRDYKDLFQTSENVYGYFNAPVIWPAAPHKSNYKFVVQHQDVWMDGDTLIDITEGYEIDTPQEGCWNEYLLLVWPAELTPGKYDMIIDMDRNRVYDKGRDILDNIDTYGQPTAGFVVASGVGAPTVKITSPSDGDTVTSRVINVEGTISDSSITNAQLIVNGESQQVGVDSGYFAGPVMVRRGANTIRAEAYNTGGLGYDQIKVIGDFPLVDMRVTLTWVGHRDVDVDLWVCDPNGEWCYFGNKQTAIGGELDVDDVGADDPHEIPGDGYSDGNGPENFTLEAGEAIPGTYHVRVHYYSDDGMGPAYPTVTILLKEGTANEVRRTIVGPELPATDAVWGVTNILMPQGTFGDYTEPTGAKRREVLPKKK